RHGDETRPLPVAARKGRGRPWPADLPHRAAGPEGQGTGGDRDRHSGATAHAREARMKAYRGEILSVPDDPLRAGPEAIRHYEDGLLVVENGLVLACGRHPELAERFAEAE